MRRRIFALLPAVWALLLCTGAAEARELVPVGQTIGLELQADGVYVVSFPEAPACSPAREAGIKIGDRILSVDETPVSGAEQLRDLVAAAGGNRLILRVDRGSRAMSFSVEPARADGAWRLGLLVQDHISGLGTVTYYDPRTGSFGALGHGVCRTGSSAPMPTASGTVTTAQVFGIRRGTAGMPGELRGSGAEGTCLGTITANTTRGVFGWASPEAWQEPAVAVCPPEEIVPGPAELLSNAVGGETLAYQVEIEGLCYGPDRCKNLQLRVTDPRLLEATGGIVQGMSGSPILQNGRLVGAVTHVLTQDPTRGYGIFITNMLEAGDAQAAAADPAA